MIQELLGEYRNCMEFREALGVLARPQAALGNLWGSSLSFLVAAFARDVDGTGSSPATLLIVESLEDAENVAGDIDALIPGRVLLFPPWESLFLEDSVPDPEECHQRLTVIEALASRRAGGYVIVAPVHALLQPVPSPETIRKTILDLKRGESYDLDALARHFIDCGYANVPIVEKPGEFSMRGDVLDVFPFTRPLEMSPDLSGERTALRLEFFGDSLESIRHFRPSTQRSLGGSQVEAVQLAFPDLDDSFKDCLRSERDVLLLDFFASGNQILIREMSAVLARVTKVFGNILGRRKSAMPEEFRRRLELANPARLGELPVAPDLENGINLEFGTVERLRAVDPDRACENLRSALDSGSRLQILCHGNAEVERIRSMLKDASFVDDGRLHFLINKLRSGFEIKALGSIVLTVRELLGRDVTRRLRTRVAPAARAIQSFLELERGDFVVHLTHGIARYLGIETFEKDGHQQEFLLLQFRGNVRIFVPVSKIDLVQKYVGSGDKTPILDKVGGVSWARKKEQVENALLCMASELLDMQARRQERPGYSFPPDSAFQEQFEAAFPYDDTPDQVRITEEIKADMLSSRPMDRLVCGDVGYGKTELAMRAAFKAVDAGRQVAILVPTTVLAEQHYRSFCSRMKDFPVVVRSLNRFRNAAEQKLITEGLADQRVDIVIGTHRILSVDVEFANLGLVVIDEEQRFGVVHKERLKRMRREVDVMTLSATPIPRTLHMALLGIRDISNLTTPPEGRSPIHTEITHFDRRKVREIILRELNRGGQILFIHNRIADLQRFKREIEEVTPEVVIEVAHGQMKVSSLEKRMMRFITGETDMLIATTIVENGIDVPSANTIFISDADRYGLADLHQLRGRVGRSRSQAYCYLLLPEGRQVNADARKRLQALVEFSGLGAGFQIAMRDLEIRGAGNLLGKEQSGHIAAVGYDMYCRLLDKCVHDVKKERFAEPVSVEIDLSVRASLPDEFISGEGPKLEIYRRISQLDTDGAVSDFRDELIDRFGALPLEVLRLLEVQKMRVLCREYGVTYVGREQANIIFRGEDTMRGLLESCDRKIAVLDGRTVAIPFYAKRRKYAQGVEDEKVFRFVLSWLSTGKFPRRGIRAKREPVV